MRRLYPE